MSQPLFQIRDLEILQTTGDKKSLLAPLNLEIQKQEVFGVIGPSGAGKSSFLKCLNRLIDLSAGLSVRGDIKFEGQSIYQGSIDADTLRVQIGMLFQQPVIFPKSILANVLFAVKHLALAPKSEWHDIAQRALTQAALWDEVKDRLSQPAQQLSVGQQQRLCLARTLATGCEVLLMDEPTSALDPNSTEAIEQLILELKQTHSIVIVTHNINQAQRVCDRLGFIGLRDGMGTLLAQGTLRELMTQRENVAEIDAYLRTTESIRLDT